MTPEQMELLSDMIADKIVERLDEYLPPKYDIAFTTIKDPVSIDKTIDLYGNPKFSRKKLLGEQLKELAKKAQKLLDEEKYELLQELTEIYNKIKKEFDNL
jgi:hypothetical protein|tara:strand:- start:119 stop:421 length:303 start_codon:yes stop_codon:yes gene_type:complete